MRSVALLKYIDWVSEYRTFLKVLTIFCSLATAQVGVDLAKSFSYNTIGNILIKSDVGNYTYPAAGQPFPHAVSSISGRVVNTTFTYDANGNQTGGNGLTLTYAVQGIRLETHSIGTGYNVTGRSKAIA